MAYKQIVCAETFGVTSWVGLNELAGNLHKLGVTWKRWMRKTR